MASPSRSYVFTINNPDGLLDYDELSLLGVRYLVYSEEAAPETGTPHFQGYLELDRPMRLRAVSRLPGFERAHLEKRRGTRVEARTYATKRDDTFIDGPYEHGDFTAGGQGARNDFVTFKKLIDSGADDKRLWDEVPDLYLRFANMVPRVRMLYQPKRDFMTKVYVHWGSTNTGKSAFVHRKSPNAFWKPRNQWWDGYDGTSDVVLDDFYGWLPFDTLLRMCDRYPMIVEVKGSSAGFAPQRIFITSNAAPNRWYTKISDGHFAAFARRVTAWYHWTAADTYTKTKELTLPVIPSPQPGRPICLYENKK